LRKEKDKSGWADKAKKAGKAEHKIENTQQENKFGSRIVIFMLGGVTYSEIRAAYEVTKLAQREVLIGGPSVCVPRDFLTALSKI